MALHLELDPSRIRGFCQRWGVAELALFGSVTRETFGAASDLDVLVTPEPGVAWSLFDLGEMRDDLIDISARPVDLVVRRALEQSPNWVRRRAILDSAEVVFAAR